MSDIVYRYHIHNKPAKGTVLTDAAKKDPTAHSFSRTTGMTGCGKEVPHDDLRWKIDREGNEKDVNCARCLHPKAAPGERKSKVKTTKTTAKKAGKGKRAAKKAAQPITVGTAVPKDKLKELRTRAKRKQQQASSGEAPEPEYDPTANENHEMEFNPADYEEDLIEQEGSHEPISRPPFDPLAHE